MNYWHRLLISAYRQATVLVALVGLFRNLHRLSCFGSHGDYAFLSKTQYKNPKFESKTITRVTIEAQYKESKARRKPMSHHLQKASKNPRKKAWKEPKRKEIWDSRKTGLEKGAISPPIKPKSNRLIQQLLQLRLLYHRETSSRSAKVTFVSELLNLTRKTIPRSRSLSKKFLHKLMHCPPYPHTHYFLL